MIVNARRLHLPIDTRQLIVADAVEVAVRLDDGKPDDPWGIDLVFEVSDAGLEQLDFLVTLLIDAAREVASRKNDLMEDE